MTFAIPHRTMDALKTIDFIVNGYMLARSHFKDLTFESVEVDDRWPHAVFRRTRAREDAVMRRRSDLSTDLPPFAFTDFAGYVPLRSDA